MDDASVDFHKEVLYFFMFFVSFDDCIFVSAEALKKPHDFYVYILYAH